MIFSLEFNSNDKIYCSTCLYSNVNLNHSFLNESNFYNFRRKSNLLNDQYVLCSSQCNFIIFISRNKLYKTLRKFVVNILSVPNR